jgi:replicative DNA helicase
MTSLTLERAVLGALMLNGDLIPEVRSLGVLDFEDRAHQKIYKALLILCDEGAPIDFVTVGDLLRAQGVFDSVVGGNQTLIDVVGCVGTPPAEAAIARARAMAEIADMRPRPVEAANGIGSA